MNGHTECVKALIAAGANPNLKNKKGETAMMIARETGKIHIIDALAVGIASESVKAIFTAKDDKTKWTDESDLMKAVREDDHYACRELLKNGANINRCNKEGYTALDIAIMSGHFDIIKEMMCYEINPYHLMKSIRLAVENSKYHNIVPLLFTPKIIGIMLRQQPDAVEWAQKHKCAAAVFALSDGQITLNPEHPEAIISTQPKAPLTHSTGQLNQNQPSTPRPFP